MAVTAAEYTVRLRQDVARPGGKAAAAVRKLKKETRQLTPVTKRARDELGRFTSKAEGSAQAATKAASAARELKSQLGGVASEAKRAGGELGRFKSKANAAKSSGRSSAMKWMAGNMARMNRDSRKSNSVKDRFGLPPAKKSGFETAGRENWLTQQRFRHKRLRQQQAMTARRGRDSMQDLAFSALAPIASLMAILAIYRRLAAAALAFGRAYASSFTDITKQKLAFKQLVPNRAASEELAAIRKHAVSLGLDIGPTVKSYQKLLAMQFKPAQARQVIAMSADLQTLGASADEVQRVLLAMTQIKAKGRVQAEELLQLSEAGVSTELVMKALEKRLGKSAVEVRKLMRAGKITAEQGLGAIGDAIKKKAGIEKFGDAARSATKTLPGMMKRARSQMEVLWLGFVERTMPKVKATLGPIVRDVLGALESPKAGRVVAALAGAFGLVVTMARPLWAMLKGFGGGFLRGFTQDGKMLEALADSSGRLNPDALRAMGDAAAWLGRGVGIVAGKVYTTIQALQALWTRVTGLASQLRSAGNRAGSALGDGLIAGILSKLGSVTGAATKLAGAADAAVVSKWQIHSPSKLAEKRSTQYMAGHGVGFDKGARKIDSQMSGLVAAPDRLLPVGGGSGGGGGRMQMQVSIDPSAAYAAAAMSASPAEYVAAVENMLVTRLADLFERATEMAGA